MFVFTMGFVQFSIKSDVVLGAFLRGWAGVVGSVPRRKVPRRTLPASGWGLFRILRQF